MGTAEVAMLSTERIMELAVESAHRMASLAGVLRTMNKSVGLSGRERSACETLAVAPKRQTRRDALMLGAQALIL